MGEAARRKAAGAYPAKTEGYVGERKAKLPTPPQDYQPSNYETALLLKHFLASGVLKFKDPALTTSVLKVLDSVI